MAKNRDNENEQLFDETTSIVTIPEHALQPFMNALNPFEIQEFNDLLPEWIAGDSLVGHLIKIHTVEKLDSFQLKTDFYKCEIEIAGHEGKYTATFFSVGVKTFFKALMSANLPLPVVVGVIRQRSTYAFQDARKFLADNR